MSTEEAVTALVRELPDVTVTPHTLRTEVTAGLLEVEAAVTRRRRSYRCLTPPIEDVRGHRHAGTPARHPPALKYWCHVVDRVDTLGAWTG